MAKGHEHGKGSFGPSQRLAKAVGIWGRDAESGELEYGRIHLVISQTHIDVCEFYKEPGLTEGSYCRRLALWAATILTSRSFGSAFLLGSDKMPSHIALEDSWGDTCSVLFPVLDIINHRPKAPVQWISREKDFSFQISDDFPQGSELWNDYGPKGNEEREYLDLYSCSI